MWKSIRTKERWAVSVIFLMEGGLSGESGIRWNSVFLNYEVNLQLSLLRGLYYSSYPCHY